MNIKSSFDEISQKYDEQRKQLIPCFQDFYHLPLSIMNCSKENPAVLDIGAGTGLFSSILMEKYPLAQITLIDLSDKMLAVAKERFSAYQNFEYITADYTQRSFDKKFDIIISALSIHHLTAADKEKLYHKCYSMLRGGGIFINADQVLSPSPALEVLHSQLWKRQAAESGLDEESLRQAYLRVSLDNPSTLQDQLRWLNEAGFTDADCLYKYYNFCVMYGKK